MRTNVGRLVLLSLVIMLAAAVGVPSIRPMLDVNPVPASPGVTNVPSPLLTATRSGSLPDVGPATRTYAVTFEPTGLPPSIGWSVNFETQPGNGFGGGAQGNANYTFHLGNGTYSFNDNAGPGYQGTPAGGSLTVSGAGLTVMIAFVAMPQDLYTVAFFESGLPNGTHWGINLSGQLMNATAQGVFGELVVFVTQNGSYSYEAVPVAGFVPTLGEGQGTITVSGSAYDQALVYVNTTVNTTATVFPVTFTESGLAPGSNWSVALNLGVADSTGTFIGFNLTNGTYEYRIGGPPWYGASPLAGSFQVDGAAVFVIVNFTAISELYNVTFLETGLPTGLTWHAELGNYLSQAPSAVPITFLEPNGSYTFVVGPVAAYDSAPLSGTVIVHGDPVVETIAFAGSTSPVLFMESGLPAGTTWWVDFGASNYSSESTELELTRAAGSYEFSIPSTDGYTASPSSGWVNVSVGGGPSDESITFATVPPNASSPVTPRPAAGEFTGVNEVLVIAGICTVAVVAPVVWLMRRLRRKVGLDPSAEPPRGGL